MGGAADAGALNVLYSSASGLEASPDVFFQGSGGVGGSLEDGDRFGSAVAKGDFDGDGVFDLAVGAPGEDIGAAGNAGAVTVLYGSPARLTAAGSQTLFQGGGAGGAAETGDAFGSAVASGILGGDGIADLVVGAPGENVGATSNAGAVNLLAGSPGGLAAGAVATQGNPEPLDLFGAAVATGDFDDTAGDDVVAGAPGETVNGRQLAGAVSVFNGPPGGLANERLLFQGTAGLPGTPRASTSSGPRWRRPTATASASGTWPSAPPARTSGRTPRPGRSTCWPGRRPARAAGPW